MDQGRKGTKIHPLVFSLQNYTRYIADIDHQGSLKRGKIEILFLTSSKPPDPPSMQHMSPCAATSYSKEGDRTLPC